MKLNTKPVCLIRNQSIVTAPNMENTLSVFIINKMGQDRTTVHLLINKEWLLYVFCVQLKIVQKWKRGVTLVHVVFIHG